MGMALSGLASGFDWKSIVDQLIEVSRAPQNRMRKEQTANSAKSNAISEIKNLVSSFKGSLSNLVSSESLYKKSATFADASTKWTASASKDTPAGQYTLKLETSATASKLTGSADLVPDLNTSTPISDIFVGRTIKTGSFTINGKQITIASSDSLDDIFGKISSSTGVSASYSGDQIHLSSAAPLSLGAPNDTSNFLQVMRLSGSGVLSGSSYQVTSAAPGLSAPKLNVPLNSSNLSGLTPLASGVDHAIIINGQSISYNSTDTVQDVLDRINKSTAGVIASFDLASGQFSLKNQTTGNVGITVSDSGTGTLGVALGLVGQTTVLGDDATFRVNGGGLLTSRSNVLDESAHGIMGLSVTANAIGEQTVTVSGDPSAVKNSLNDFVSKYNAVQNAIEKYTKVTVDGKKVTSGILAGNSQLSILSRSLRSMLYQAGSGITGSVQRLSDIGIGFSGIESTISITNSSLLDSKLSTAADDVSAYFSTSNSGLIDRLDKFLSGYVSDSSSATGGFQAQIDSLSEQNTSLDKQIDDVERRLTAQRSLLESSFISMESAQSNFQQQSSYLSKTFSGGK
ncbi:MAG: flagellar filament capping protein FliD [bacterium]